jgi:hypothetical protein
MAGVKFTSPFEDKFFIWFMENELDGQLWFWLKLAS